MAISYLLGYTLNRVTLFALIFSIGILVDDAIVVVENMVRRFRMPANSRRPLSEVAVEAVAEVGNPTVLATLTVIAAILPMAFVRGLRACLRSMVLLWRGYSCSHMRRHLRCCNRGGWSKESRIQAM